jgi:hypothetical protein
MTYSNLKLVINESYATFSKNYILRKRIGADDKYSLKNMVFVKGVYKTLMNQVGDEDVDTLLKTDIQNIIALFNKYSDSTVNTEYE